MPRLPLPSLTLSLPALLLAQTALADVTAAEVWGDWKSYMQTMGYTLEATETAQGDDLTISGLTVSMQMPDNAGAMAMSLGDITFAQDGAAVNVLLPDSLPLTIDVTPAGDDGKPARLDFRVDQTGQTLRVSGDPQNMAYAYAADSMDLSLAELTVDGQNYGAANAKVNVSATTLTSDTAMTAGDLRSYRQTGGIDSLSYDILIDNPFEPVKLALQGAISGIAFDGGGSIPTAVDTADMAAMLAAGFAVEGNFTYASGNSDVAVTDPSGGDFSTITSSQGGRLGISMAADRLAYTAEQNDVKVNMTIAQLPFPIDFSVARGGGVFSMPLSAGADPQDFALGLTMAEFTMSDMIWSLFDPTQQLPRDPATIELDLTGQATLAIDVMDPAAAAGAVQPGQVNALDIRTLLVDAVGARLEGNGAITFDNSDLATYNGMPKPVGTINLALAGGNALMDKLVAMGLLPEEQAMGARMMMGLFAVPGDAPDTLKSTVEFNAEGQVLANGQRIR